MLLLYSFKDWIVDHRICFHRKYFLINLVFFFNFCQTRKQFSCLHVNIHRIITSILLFYNVTCECCFLFWLQRLLFLTEQWLSRFAPILFYRLFFLHYCILPTVICLVNFQIASCMTLGTVSYSIFRVSEFVKNNSNKPNPQHPPNEVSMAALSLYLALSYYLLVFMYSFAISIILVIGTHAVSTYLTFSLIPT